MSCIGIGKPTRPSNFYSTRFWVGGGGGFGGGGGGGGRGGGGGGGALARQTPALLPQLGKTISSMVAATVRATEILATRLPRSRPGIFGSNAKHFLSDATKKVFWTT